MLISIPPVIIEGETKTTLFPWYVYPPVEPFVCVSTSRTLRCPNAAETVEPSLPECWQKLLAERQHFFCR